jgi:hypothetical protein
MSEIHEQLEAINNRSLTIGIDRSLQRSNNIGIFYFFVCFCFCFCFCSVSVYCFCLLLLFLFLLRFNLCHYSTNCPRNVGRRARVAEPKKYMFITFLFLLLFLFR